MAQVSPEFQRQYDELHNTPPDELLQQDTAAKQAESKARLSAAEAEFLEQERVRILAGNRQSEREREAHRALLAYDQNLLQNTQFITELLTEAAKDLTDWPALRTLARKVTANFEYTMNHIGEAIARDANSAPPYTPDPALPEYLQFERANRYYGEQNARIAGRISRHPLPADHAFCQWAHDAPEPERSRRLAIGFGVVGRIGLFAGGIPDVKNFDAQAAIGQWLQRQRAQRLTPGLS